MQAERLFWGDVKIEWGSGRVYFPGTNASKETKRRIGVVFCFTVMEWKK